MEKDNIQIVNEFKWIFLRWAWVILGPALQVLGVVLGAQHLVHYTSGTDPKSELTEYAAAGMMSLVEEKLDGWVANKIALDQDFHDARMAKLPKCSK